MYSGLLYMTGAAVPAASSIHAMCDIFSAKAG